MVDSTLTSPEFDVYLGKDLPDAVHWDRNSMRWTGSIQSCSAGEYEFWLTSDDAVRFWLDDTLRIDFWNGRGEDRTHLVRLTLKEETQYPFRVEQARLAEATKLRLAWRTPGMRTPKYDPALETGNRQVYLPRTAGWYDFWTGEKLSGGKTVSRNTPIDIIPVYVRAGSIVPMGPVQEYAGQMRYDSLELRIYPGEDATFVLYEDEGDNYDYEKGAYTLIPFLWDEETQVLTINERFGEFPGMLKSRTFRIVWVSQDHGISDLPEAFPDMVIQYNGQPVSVKRPSLMGE